MTQSDLAPAGLVSSRVEDHVCRGPRIAFGQICFIAGGGHVESEEGEESGFILDIRTSGSF